MAILATEKVLTLDYWKPAYKLKVGDYVFDRNGQPVQVKLIQEYRSNSCYEVMFDDHLHLSGDDRLQLPTENKKYRDRTFEYKQVREFTKPLKPILVVQLLELSLKNKRNRLIYSVPTTKPLALPHQDLPVPPFIFGFWFFNRLTNHNMVPIPNTNDFIHEKFKDLGYKIKPGWIRLNREREFNTIPSIRSQLIPNIPTRIPTNYLLASPEQRKELLSGILYAKPKQYNKKKDRFRFTTLNRTLAFQVQYLVDSLGIRSTILFHGRDKNYTITFRSRIKLMEEQDSPPIRVHQSRRYITKISPLPPQLCVHIETTAPDNTILVGEGFIACR